MILALFVLLQDSIIVKLVKMETSYMVRNVSILVTLDMLVIAPILNALLVLLHVSPVKLIKLHVGLA